MPTNLTTRTKPTTSLSSRVKPEPVEASYLLKEDGDYLLLESGFYITLVEASDGTQLSPRIKP